VRHQAVFFGAGLSLAALTLTLTLPLAPTRGDDAAPPASIDAYFERFWNEQKITPAPRSTDWDFLRRASLDVLGRPPHPDEVRAFEKAPDRARKVDELLAADEAASFFADTWLRVLVDYRFDETAPLRVAFPEFREYLRDAWTRDRPWREVAGELIGEQGDSRKHPAVNFTLAALDPKEPPYELATRTARVFLGERIHCARCHDHPSEPWKQADFWGLVAFFTGARTKARTTFEGYGVKLVEEPAKKLKIPGSELEVEPCFLDGRKPAHLENARRSLAELITGSDAFARATVNRVWAHFMGRGFVEPLDGFGSKAKPSHPELLGALAGEFQKDSSLRHLARTILLSRVYQLSCESTPGVPDSAHAHMLLKPQTPIQLLNSLSDTLELDVFFKQIYKGFVENKALPEPYRNEAVFRIYLQQFMQKLLSPGGLPPEEAPYTGSVRLALRLMNNKDLQGLVRAEWGQLKRVMAEHSVPEERIKELFYVFLARPPTEEELARYLAHVKRRKGDAASYEDTAWVLLNSSEFFFNH
jgi:hypothetical protein